MGGDSPPARAPKPRPPALVFPSLPSSGSSNGAGSERKAHKDHANPTTPGRKAKGLASDDESWSSIFGELNTAIDDAAMEISPAPGPPTAPATAAEYSTMFLAPPDLGNQKRKRTRTRSHKRSLSVGAEPNSFCSPGSNLPLLLDPADESSRGQRIPMRPISGFHPHLYTLRLSSSRPAEGPPPELSSSALLASPIRLGKPLGFGRDLEPSLNFRPPPATEPKSEPRPTSSRPIAFPGAESPPSPDHPDHPDHFSPSSQSDSPGSWLRSPMTNRARFRSDGSDADAIMFTPRQLDFEGDEAPLLTGRRLQWSHFDLGDPVRPTATSLPVGSSLPGGLQSGFQGMALGPAFEPSECSRPAFEPSECARPAEPPSPAFALETEPGVSRS